MNTSIIFVMLDQIYRESFSKDNFFDKVDVVRLTATFTQAKACFDIGWLFSNSL